MRQLAAGAVVLAAALALGSPGRPLAAWAPRVTTSGPAERASAMAASVSRPLAVGRASWYGPWHHGKRTASGERFDMNALTAAHRTIPFGTRLFVVNLRNGRAVAVRVNDRGPVPRDRIIDLSYAAARRLGGVADGVFPVSLARLPRE